MARQEALLQELQQTFTDEHDALQQLRTEVHTCETDVQGHQDKIEKYSGQRNTVKTNREYKTLTDEIETEHGKIGDLEENLLVLMDQLETMSNQTKDQDTRLKKEEAEWKTFQSETLQKTKILETEITKVEESRGTGAVDVSEEVLSAYNRVLTRHPEGALVAVKDEVCQGCFARVLVQDVNRIMKGSELVTCRTCSRILFLDDEDEDSEE